MTFQGRGDSYGGTFIVSRTSHVTNNMWVPQSVYGRDWATHKSTCNSETSKSSGLAKHFRNGGGKNDLGKEKTTLSITLIDFIETSTDILSRVGHIPGPQCNCSECNRLKRKEDMWILRLGTFYGDSSLNHRDEIKSDTRCNYQ